MPPNGHNPTDTLHNTINQALGVKLSNRQIECAALTLLNLNVQQVAHKLSISDTSARSHLDAVRSKLGLLKIRELTEYLFEKDLLSLFFQVGVSHLPQKTS